MTNIYSQLEFVCEVDESRYLTRRKDDLFISVTRVGQNYLDQLSAAAIDTLRGLSHENVSPLGDLFYEMDDPTQDICYTIEYPWRGTLYDVILAHKLEGHSFTKSAFTDLLT